MASVKFWFAIRHFWLENLQCLLPIPLVVLKMQASKPRMMTSIMKTQPPSERNRSKCSNPGNRLWWRLDADHSKMDWWNTLYFTKAARYVWADSLRNSKLAFNMLKEYWPGRILRYISFETQKAFRWSGYAKKWRQKGTLNQAVNGCSPRTIKKFLEPSANQFANIRIDIK